MNTEDIRFFDTIAPKWDSMEIRSTPSRINHILDRIPLHANAKVLDLGTGTGVLVPYLWERIAPYGTVTAVDLSDGMLKCAKEKYGELPDVDFIKADFENDPLDGRFDVVMMYCVYPHLSAPFETIQNLIDNNLREHGVIVIAFPSDESFINHVHGHKKVTSDRLPSALTLAERLRSAGLNATAIEASSDAYIVTVGRPTRGN